MLNFDDLFNNVKEFANEAIKSKAIEIIGRELYEKIEAEGGAITADIESGVYEILGCSEVLEKEVLQKIEDFKNK